MRSRNKIYNANGVYFITSTVVDWLELFNSDNSFQILADCINFYIRKKNFKVHAYVFMKNHFHLICSGENISKSIGSIKSFSAKKMIEKLKDGNNYEVLNKLRETKKKHKTDRQFQFWQEGFYPKEVLSNDELKQKIEYIHYNPVKKNYCAEMAGWKYSSANYYETGIEGIIFIERII
ncbi:MAG: transposase [Ignavibacteria bacterium]|nr:transposase [Ignavibacteria bacterium]